MGIGFYVLETAEPRAAEELTVKDTQHEKRTSVILPLGSPSFLQKTGTGR